MQKKKTIAIFTTDQGHKSISDAVAESLAKDYEIKIFHHRDVMLDVYLPFYYFFPQLFKIPFQFGQHAQMTGLINNFFRKKLSKKIRAFVEEHKPDVMINAYFMFTPVLEDLKQEQNIPLINILTDPRSLHALVISNKADINLAFDKHQVEYCKNIYPEAKFFPVGWFVRDNFEQAAALDKKTLRKKLKLAPNQLTILLASGFEGTTAISKVVGLLFETDQKLQMIVACGKNKAMYRGMLGLKRILQKTKSKTTIIPLKFTTDLHLYMAAADLVVGKAGPNTLFETVATRTPFFAITHITGQEDGNLEIIEEYKLGFVEENPQKASKLINEVCNNPEQLTELQPTIDTMAMYNQKADQQLKILLDKLLS